MLERFSLANKVSVVTGAGQGMGFEIAKALAEVGSTVVVAELVEERGRSAAQAIVDSGHSAEFVHLDVRDTDSVLQVAQFVKERFGKLDVLVNNAGIVKNASTLETTDADWLEVIDVNLNGVFRCSRELGRIMVEQGSGGAIVNMSSNSAFIVDWPQIQPAYNASKAGVAQLTKSLAAEWAQHDVRVNAIAPGFIDTAITAEGQANPDWSDRWLALTPMGRFGQPSEIAPLAVYLASDASSFMTGSVILIDGGYTVW